MPRNLEKENQWEKETYKKITIKFHKEKDAELLGKLEKIEGLTISEKIKNILRSV